MNSKMLNDLRLLDLIELYNKRNKEKHIYSMFDFNEYISKKGYSPSQLIKILENDYNAFRAKDKYFLANNKDKIISFSTIEDFVELLNKENVERRTKLQKGIYNYLQNLTPSELICLYNNRSNKEIDIYIMNDFDNVIAERGISPLKLAAIFENNYFDFKDKYFYIKKDNSINSFNGESIDDLPFDLSTFADYVAKEKTPFSLYYNQLFFDDEER